MGGISGLPEYLPFAPRPHRGESLTSWFLRLAGANDLTREELRAVVGEMGGARAPDLVFDYDQPSAERMILAKLARVSENSIRALDLKTCFPCLDPSGLLLEDPTVSMKVRSVYCPQCFGEQRRNRVPPFLKAEWGLAVVTRCMEHETPLEQSCPECGINEPVAFHLPTTVRCRNCWHDLAQTPRRDVPRRESGLVALQRLMVGSLAGQPPAGAWMAGLSAGQFRRLVADLIWLFTTGDFRPYRDTLVNVVAPERYRCRERYNRSIDPVFSGRPWREREAVFAAIATLMLPGAMLDEQPIQPRRAPRSPLDELRRSVLCNRRQFLAHLQRWPRAFHRHLSKPYDTTRVAPEADRLSRQRGRPTCETPRTVQERLEALLLIPASHFSRRKAHARRK